MRGNLIEKARLLRFTRNDNFLNRDLGERMGLSKVLFDDMFLMRNNNSPNSFL